MPLLIFQNRTPAVRFAILCLYLFILSKQKHILKTLMNLHELEWLSVFIT